MCFAVFPRVMIFFYLLRSGSNEGIAASRTHSESYSNVRNKETFYLLKHKIVTLDEDDSSS